MLAIRVSDETWKRLQKWAVPLEDTVDSTLAKVLDAAERRRAQTGASGAPPTRSGPSGRRPGLGGASFRRRRSDNPSWKFSVTWAGERMFAISVRSWRNA